MSWQRRRETRESLQRAATFSVLAAAVTLAYALLLPGGTALVAVRVVAAGVLLIGAWRFSRRSLTAPVEPSPPFDRLHDG